MSALSEIEPRTHRTLMELVSEAGVDVSDWSNMKGGARKAASNPKYCYEWAVVEPEKLVVLNLWHKDMREDSNGVVTYEMNPRKWAYSHPGTTRPRALRMDRAIQEALKNNLPIHVVVGAGTKVSRMEKRLLDSVPWTITSYNSETGDCTLRRGRLSDKYVDQFDLHNDDSEPPCQQTITSQVFVRSAEVRKAALLRAAGKCEWCAQPGFTMTDGRTYLETHHVIPLSEGGPDTTANVAALCANHHREAHHGLNAVTMRQKFIDMLNHDSALKKVIA